MTDKVSVLSSHLLQASEIVPSSQCPVLLPLELNLSEFTRGDLTMLLGEINPLTLKEHGYRSEYNVIDTLGS